METINSKKLFTKEQMVNSHRQALVHLVYHEQSLIRNLSDYRSTINKLGTVSGMSPNNRVYRLNLLASALYTVKHIRDVRKTIDFLFEQK